MQYFAIRWGEASDRLDPHFYHPRFEQLLAVLRQGPHEILGNIAELHHQKWKPEEHPEEMFRYIEINGVSRGTGEVSFTEVPTKEAPNRAQMMVQKDDIIVSLTRPHHGSIALIDDDLDGCIVSTGFAVLRKIKNPTLSRRYLGSVLQSQLCLNQMLQRSSGGNYPAITKDQLTQILIPIPEVEFQHTLVSQMQTARKARAQKLKEADALLSGIDDFLLNQLGIVPPQAERLVYGILLKEASYANRLSADYFHPERLLAIKSIRSSQHANRVERLKDIANFHRDIETASNPEEYIGLANVRGNTGELIEVSTDEAKGQCFRFHTGDILFARLRPYLNKVYRAEHGGVCSTEFHVIRVQNVHDQEDSILPDYLAVVLRSSIVVAQTKHMMTGNTHPRLANDDVVDLLIPIPSLDRQKKIVKEFSRRSVTARRFREEAAKEWEAAKAQFEAQLLTGEVS